MARFFLQFFKFVGVSGVGYVLDFSLFFVFGFWSDNYALNNFVSAFVAFSFVFVFSAKKIFYDETRLVLKWSLYALYQVALIASASVAVGFLSVVLRETLNLPYEYVLAKLLVTPFTLVCNFCVAKFLLEKRD